MNKDYIHTGRANQKLETRNKILKAALSFINKGQSFNLEDVAKKSGVSRATIYRYYSNVEILAAEASIFVFTITPEEIIAKYKHKDIKKTILGIQDYFNQLTLNNENAFRKYLSIAIVANQTEIKRGARRKKALELALLDYKLTPKKKKELINILTLFMGIEPVIITKDVSSLTNEQSLNVLKKGLESVLDQYLS